MNISAISMLNRMPNFAAHKQILHRNSDEDWYPEKEPEKDVVIHRNSDEDWYPEVVDKKPVDKKPAKPTKTVSYTPYEKGPNGVMGVWTRDGEGYAFFTPEKATKAKATVAKTAAAKAYQENPEDTKARYIRWGM